MSASSVDAGSSELSRILGISRAFKASKALNLSAKLGLYTLLSQHQQGLHLPPVGDGAATEDHAGPGLTWKEIAMHMGWRAHEGFRGATDFLDLLVTLGMLYRVGDGPEAR